MTSLTPTAQHSHHLRQELGRIHDSNLDRSVKIEQFKQLMDDYAELALANYKKTALVEARERGEELVLPPVVRLGDFRGGSVL